MTYQISLFGLKEIKKIHFVAAFLFAVGVISSTLLVGTTHAASTYYQSISCGSQTASRTWASTADTYRFNKGAFCLTTSNGRKAIFQTDGNFVVYNGSTPTWASNTSGALGNLGWLSLQGDGNIVIYRSNGTVAWSAYTQQNGSNGAVRKITMQTDGNLVVYRSGAAYVWTTSIPMWASNTAGR